MTHIGIILASIRPQRVGGQVAAWVHDVARERDEATFEVVDLADFPLPAELSEPPRLRPPDGSSDPRIRAWADKIRSFDGFVLVTPEYNFSVPGALKTALDHLYSEWNHKPVGFVSYGVVGGARAVQHLRDICGALQMADVAHQVTLPLQTEFEGFSTFQPGPHCLPALGALLDQVIAWSVALAPLRSQDAVV